jgi:hypothetical protein
LAIKEKTLGLDHLGLATSLNNLAELYRTREERNGRQLDLRGAKAEAPRLNQHLLPKTFPKEAIAPADAIQQASSIH